MATRIKAELFPEAPEAPVEVDLGCGDGTFLVELAAAHPERRVSGGQWGQIGSLIVATLRKLGVDG